MWGDVGRCGEMWGDVGRCGEMWGDVGRCGEMEIQGRYRGGVGEVYLGLGELELELRHSLLRWVGV